MSTGPYQIASDDAMQDAQVVSEILETLDRYSATYARHDLDGILALFAPGPDIVLLGTGADEKRIGFDQVEQQFERNFDETEASTITWGWRHGVGGCRRRNRSSSRWKRRAVSNSDDHRLGTP